MFGKIPFDTENHKSVIFQRLNEMRETKVHCDFVIKIGSEEIEAHRNILSAGSDYFAAMLSHDTKEKQTGIAELKEADPSCVRRCIDLIYTGLPPDLNYDIEQLVYTAHLLQIPSLCEGIWKAFENDLNPETFYLVLRLANLYNCEELCEKCDCFALENFKKIYKMKEFCQFDKSYIEKIMVSEEGGTSDKFKLDALLHWVNFDVGARSKFFDEMLGNISLSKMPAENLRYFVENEPLVNGNLKQLKKFSMAALDNSFIKSEIVDNSSKLNAIVLFDKAFGYLQGFNPTENKWIQMHYWNDDYDMAYDFSAVCVTKFIYIFKCDKSVYRLRYLDKSATWEQVESMMDDHGAYPPCVILQNNIYIIGSCGSSLSKSVEMFDAVANKWFKLADKPQEINGSQPVALENKVFCCGGIVDGQVTDVVQCFNPDDSTWINKAPMNEAKQFLSAVVFDNKIYALGGLNGDELRTVECYDPGPNKWSFLKPMNKPRHMFRTYVMEGNMYAVGGCYYQNSIEKYDIGNNEWKDFELHEKLTIVESVNIKQRF